MPPKAASRTRLIIITLAAALLGAGAPITYMVLNDLGAIGPSAPKSPGRPFIATGLLFADAAGVPASGPASPSGAPGTRSHPYIETDLLFSTARGDEEQPVTEQEFRSFLDESVSPRFPGGLTVEDAYGQYRNRSGTIAYQRTYKVVLLYPAGQARHNDPVIEQIRTAYTKRFDQESVLRIDGQERVRF